MRLLFVKHSLAWPRVSGHDVYCYHMMRSLAPLGHDISLATAVAASSEALDGLSLAAYSSLPSCPRSASRDQFRRLSYFQRRFQSYWGIDQAHVEAVAQLSQSLESDAVIAAGLEGPLYLAALRDTVRIWYAADEWVWHHTTQLRAGADMRSNASQALVKGMYERTHMPAIDRVWVVSRSERRAMRWIGGADAVDVIPCGVDAEHYRPTTGSEFPRTAVFWGRLDFGPNIQALEWFCQRVWPSVRIDAPDARLTIIGFHPVDEIRRLDDSHGIRVLADVPDLREHVGRQAVVVLPFVSGGGIKNKLLEAASMGKTILCSPRACLGLRADGPLPLLQARTPGEWKRALLALWADDERRRMLGAAARRWVTEHHSWTAAAQSAVAGLERSLRAGRGQRPIQARPLMLESVETHTGGSQKARLIAGSSGGCANRQTGSPDVGLFDE